MSKKKKFEFRIREIDLINKSLNVPDNLSGEEVKCTFAININHGVDLPKNLLIVSTTISVLDAISEEKYGSLKANCTFEILNISDFVNIVDGQIMNIDSEVALTFNSISISTVRGIMFSEFRGTLLHSAILPIIDPNTLVEEIKDN